MKMAFPAHLLTLESISALCGCQSRNPPTLSISGTQLHAGDSEGKPDLNTVVGDSHPSVFCWAFSLYLFVSVPAPFRNLLEAADQLPRNKGTQV